MSSKTRERSRAASTSLGGMKISTMLWQARRRARNAASRLSFLYLLSAAGFCIFETAATTQSAL